MNESTKLYIFDTHKLNKATNEIYAKLFASVIFLETHFGRKLTRLSPSLTVDYRVLISYSVAADISRLFAVRCTTHNVSNQTFHPGVKIIYVVPQLNPHLTLPQATSITRTLLEWLSFMRHHHHYEDF